MVIKTGEASGPMSFESAENILGESFKIQEDDGSETFGQLELAAAQMAICFSINPYSIEIPNVDAIEKRIENHKASVLSGEKSGMDTLDVRDILTERENEFYPATRTIVGLIYHAARDNAETFKPTRPARAGRRSAIL